jgi:hypothetical protein
MQAKAREEWTELDLYDGQDDHQKKKTIKVTNPEFPIPDGIDVFEDFLSESQSNEILAEIANEQFTWEGFEQRRRGMYVQHVHKMPHVLFSYMYILV